MTATTVTLSSANTSVFGNELKTYTRKRKLPNADPQGVFPFSVTTEIATTSIDETDDEVYLIYFPSNYDIYLLDLEMTVDDLDTHATPTLVLDLNMDTGSAEVTLINDTTIGQGGGSDKLDLDGGHYLRSLSGNYLATKVVTGAATAATGTVTVKGMVYVGKLTAYTGT